MGTRGRPKISEFVEHCISYKVMQWAKHYNITHYKAWFKLVEHKLFPKLIQSIYKNAPRQSLTRSQEFWVQRLITSKDAQRKFYTKHVKKWVMRRSGIASLQDWSFKYIKIKGLK